MTGKVSAPRIAIVGGGFTGAAVTTHLALRTQAALAVDVIEPRAMLGGGVAYSSLDPAHRTNVAAARMSLFPDDESHFTRWLTDTRALEDDPDAVLADGRIYPRRQIFGNYVADQLDRAARTGQAMVRHLRDRAIGIRTSPDGWAIGLASGRTIGADLVVLAVSHPPPQAPQNVYCAIAEHRAFVPDPWALGALRPIMPMDNVLIMGTALSMADVVASLEQQGHRGHIIAFSRRGLLSRAHAAASHEPFGSFAHEPMLTASAALRCVRQSVWEADRNGTPWQSVIDAMRRDGQAVWQKLASAERARLLRHLRPYWEVHRYRVAPQIGAVLERRRANGSLEIVAAGLDGIAVVNGRIRTELKLRGQRANGRRRVIESDAFVLTTGPAHASAVRSNPALQCLAETGRVQPDEFRLGLMVDRQHRAVPRSGPALRSLLVAGPLARGTFGELMGLPQVAQHAQDVAAAALAEVQDIVAARPYLAVVSPSKHEFVDSIARHTVIRPISSRAAG